MTKMILPESVSLCHEDKVQTAPGASAHSEARAIAQKKGWCLIKTNDWKTQLCMYWVEDGAMKYREYRQEVAAK